MINGKFQHDWSRFHLKDVKLEDLFVPPQLRAQVTTNYPIFPEI